MLELAQQDTCNCHKLVCVGGSRSVGRSVGRFSHLEIVNKCRVHKAVLMAAEGLIGSYPPPIPGFPGFPSH